VSVADLTDSQEALWEFLKAHAHNGVVRLTLAEIAEKLEQKQTRQNVAAKLRYLAQAGLILRPSDRRGVIELVPKAGHTCTE
jgi:CTP-dependent riboflavin kinase